MGVFLKLSRADNSMVGGPVWLKFELLDILHVVYTYEFKMDQMNSNRENVATSIFRRSVVKSGRISNSSKIPSMSSLPESMKMI